ncbi:hypothetical protein [Proteus mirabilis]|uniref:hypothetical protein n=1 Tax=Proteus mirabilis TaxID=584 RepID=UPI0034D75F14
MFILDKELLNEIIDVERHGGVLSNRLSFQYYGLDNPEAINNIIQTGRISIDQDKFRTDGSFKTRNAVYFTDNLAQAINYYATRRSSIRNDRPGRKAYVFVIHPNSINKKKVFFDEYDFYIAMLGILIFKMSRKGALDKGKKGISVVLKRNESGEFKVQTDAKFSDSQILNKIWSKAFDIAGNLVVDKVNTATPLFDMVRNIDKDDGKLMTLNIGSKGSMYKDIPLRYNKPESFSRALAIFNELNKKDPEFQVWMRSMYDDLVDGKSPDELFNRYIFTAKMLSERYQRMLAGFVNEFCSSFAYKSSLSIFGYFVGDKLELATEAAKKKIDNIGNQILDTANKKVSINEIMNEFRKAGLNIEFVYSGKK